MLHKPFGRLRVCGFEDTDMSIDHRKICVMQILVLPFRVPHEFRGKLRRF